MAAMRAMMMRALSTARGATAQATAVTAVSTVRSWTASQWRAAATLSAQFDAKVASSPFHDAVVLESAADPMAPRDETPAPYKLSFRELGKAVDAFANGMEEVGVRSGDTILSVWDVAGGGTSSVEYAYVQVSCNSHKLGASESRGQ